MTKREPCKPCAAARQYLPEMIRKRLEAIERKKLDKANASRPTPK